eukprot:scpid68832/ scgid10799/ 
MAQATFEAERVSSEGQPNSALGMLVLSGGRGGNRQSDREANDQVKCEEEARHLYYDGVGIYEKKLDGTHKDKQNMVALCQKQGVEIRDTFVCEDESPSTVLGKLKDLFRSNFGGFVVYFSGHGNQEGAWCLKEGNVTFYDVISRWVERPKDKQPPESDVRYKQQKLLIIADCCYAGMWAEALTRWYANTSNHSEFGRVYVQASCDKDKVSCDSELGSIFTLAYCNYTDPVFHRGAATTQRLLPDEEARENAIMTRCHCQQPRSFNVDTARQVHSHVQIGRGFILTNSWIPILKALPPVAVGNSASRPPGQLSFKTRRDLAKEMLSSDDVEQLGGYAGLEKEAKRILDENRGKVVQSAMKVLEAIVETHSEQAGEVICSCLKKMRKNKTLGEYRDRLLPGT